MTTDIDTEDLFVWQPSQLGNDPEFDGDDGITVGPSPAHTLEFNRDDKVLSAIFVWVYAGSPTAQPGDWRAMCSVWHGTGTNPANITNTQDWFAYRTYVLDDGPYEHSAQGEAVALYVAQLLATQSLNALNDLDPSIAADVLGWDGEPYEPEGPDDQDADAQDASQPYGYLA